MSSIVGSLKDVTNPFVRMINHATSEDGNLNVPFYQLEEIREATFQSEYACDTVHRALLQRLEYYNYPFIVSKTLGIIRVLMMEGPGSFNNKMGSASGRLLQIINEPIDTRRGSVEERNKELAEAIHKAITGDSKPLVKFGTSDTTSAGRAAVATSAGGKVLTHKSDFQVQQEREQRMHKKRMDEEKTKSSIVVNDRLYDSFDGSLPPLKLVETIVASPKKRFAPEELASFASATVQTGKIDAVCAALDAVLRDGKASLQNRYKVLTIIEALVAAPSGGDVLPEAQLYFKQHALGWQRHLSIERQDNPAKAEAAKGVAQRISGAVVNAQPALPSNRPRGASGVSAQQQQSAGGQPRTTASPPAPQPQQQQHQWQWNGPNQAPTSGSSMDDLFTNLNFKTASTPTPPAPYQQQQQQQQQHSWQQQWHVDASSSGRPEPPRSNSAPALQPQPVAMPPPGLTSPTMTAAPNNSITMSYDYPPPAPNTSFASFVQPPSQSQSQPSPAQQHHQQQPVDPNVQQQDALRRQMEEFQRNMMMMMQQVMQQQQQQQLPQTASPPPPSPPVHEVMQQQQQVQQPATSDASFSSQHQATVRDRAGSEASLDSHTHSVGSHNPPQPRGGSLEAAACAAGQTVAALNQSANSSFSKRSGVDVAEDAEHPPRTLTTPPPPPPMPSATAPPTTAQQPSTSAVDPQAATAMLLQLQQQMEATQRMLAQQQAAFQMLQAQLMPQSQQQQQQ